MREITNNDILKAVLMLRRWGNTYNTKEEQIAEQKDWVAKGFYPANTFFEWIDSLREDLKKTPEQREEESRIACEEMAAAEAEWEWEQRHSFSTRDEWDDLWDDRAREVGAIQWF